MKIFFTNILINILLIVILTYIFLYSNNIKENVIFVISTWKDNLIPSIFPFLLLSNLLIEYGFVNFISKIFGVIVSKIYNLPKKASFAIIGSIFTGFPTGAKYTKDLLINNDINIEDANHLITFTSFSNPIFVISVIGEGLLKSKNIGIIIFIIHLLTGLIIGLFFKKKNSYTYNNNKLIKYNNSFITNLINSINDSFHILVNILGIIIFFSILIEIIDTFIEKNIVTYIVKGFLEITSSIINISQSNYSLKLKASLIGSFISFNGLSVHFQIKSIIEGTPIQYRKYLIARILHSLLCFICLYLIIN